MSLFYKLIITFQYSELFIFSVQLMFELHLKKIKHSKSKSPFRILTEFRHNFEETRT